ncbi:MAG: DUF814 domain-containing protein [Armatimonadetes bacterium]|nr:DUF814 domain-containing protein [Armatimonadota bacterium]
MTGPRSNAILVTEQRTIIDAARKRQARAPSSRAIWPGLRYQPLPGIRPALTGESIQLCVSRAAGATVAERIQNACRELGLADAPANAAAWRCGAECESPDIVEAISRIVSAALGSPTYGWIQRSAPDGVVHAFAFEPAPLAGAIVERVSTISEALERAQPAGAQAAQATKQPFAFVLETALKRSTRALAASQLDIAESTRADELQALAELLAANLWQIRAGSDAVSVVDYSSGTENVRSVELDPELSPGENVKRAFDRARKMVRTRAMAASRSDELTARIKRLESALACLAAGERESAAQELLVAGDLPGSARDARGATPTSGASGGVPGKVRSLTSPGGYQVLVGLSATGNDLLTTRLARPSDLWLHVRAGASAHVIIRTNGHPEGVDADTIQFAAVQCALHSEQKHAAFVAVDITERRYVRKPKGAPAGSVLITRERTVHVSPAKRELG